MLGGILDNVSRDDDPMNSIIANKYLPMLQDCEINLNKQLSSQNFILVFQILYGILSNQSNEGINYHIIKKKQAQTKKSAYFQFFTELINREGTCAQVDKESSPTDAEI